MKLIFKLEENVKIINRYHLKMTLFYTRSKNIYPIFLIKDFIQKIWFPTKM